MTRCLAVFVLALSQVTPAAADDWPQWRGPGRDGVSKETGLLQEWPAGGPPVRWKATDIGSGYSSPAIVAGRVYLQTTLDKDEFALALDEKSGDKVWSVPIGTVGENRGPQYPGTRSTPTIDGNLMYCLASGGELVCLERSDGKLKWKKNLQQDFDGKPGDWAYSESVLIDGEKLICTPGGKTAALAALDKLTGDVLWKAVIPDGGTAEYSSIMVVRAGDSKEYVQFLRKGIFGVDAKTGKFLWRYDHSIDPAANILTPIIAGDRVFSAGARSGGGLVELKTDGGAVTASEVYFERPLGAGIGGAVLVDGQLYGTQQLLFCADFATGKVKWSDRAIGPASICYADGRLYVRVHGDGDMALVEASADGYREKGRFPQPERSKSPAWPHPVVANGGLYLHDQGVLLCYDVKAANRAAAEPPAKTGDLRLGANPVTAHIDTVLETASGEIRQFAFDGDDATFFASKQNPTSSDHFTLVFERPVAAKAIAVVTGRPDGSDRLDAGRLEVSENGETFETIGQFAEGSARGEPGGRNIHALRIRPGADLDHSLAICEISIESEPAVARFKYPIEFTVDVSDAPHMRDWADKVARICEQAYPMINDELKSDGHKPPHLVTMVLKTNYRGVAEAGGGRITGSVKYFTDHPDDVGAMVHETAHVVQNYRSRGNPGWLVEGVADYVRFFKFEPGNLGPIDAQRAHYNSSYRVSAAFLAYVVEKYEPELVPKLNKLMREGNYREDIFKDLTGKTVEELDEEWRATLK